MPKTTRPKSKATTARPKQETSRAPVQQRNATESCGRYISPINVAKRWDTSRSSVDRVAKREKFKQFFPAGEGKNGSVRYLLKEVIAYENRRLT